MSEKITLDDLQGKIAKGVNLIDFYATWCGPCKMIAPVVESIESEFPEVQFFKFDVDKELEIAAYYGVRTIPAFVVVRDGEVLDQFAGMVNKTTIVNALQKALAKDN